MARSSRTPLFSSWQLSKISRTLMSLAGVILLLAAVRPAVGEVSQKAPQKAVPQPCKAPTLENTGANDQHAFENYKAAVAVLLKQGRFEELDCLADTARSTKSRLPGGMWKLRALYLGIAELPGHPTDPDWQAHLENVQRWMAARPQSITARVLLARVYVLYAFEARGSDTSDSVTDNGWKLFNQRLALAKSILDEAAKLPAKCPEWYLVMQKVALGQGWDKAQATELLKKAVAFEPDYFLYYRNHAFYLLPRWNGEEGDSSRFAAESADRVGGDAGDILYFQIGVQIVCACDEPEYGRMSWPRLQKGYALLEKKYGVSLSELNSFALMATKSGDSVVADEAFKRIGDNFDKDIWMTESYFKSNKEWAAQMGPAEAKSRKILQEAEAGVKTPEGIQYQKQVEQALAPVVRQCVQDGKGDQLPFVIVVQVGKDGVPDDVWPRTITATAQCVLRQLYESHMKKAAAFPPPPHPAYWLRVDLDPTAPNMAAK